MKNSRKAAHLLAGSIMTAATLIGGAGIADARETAAEEPEKTETLTFNYAKIQWEYTEIHSAKADDAFVKIADLPGDTAARATDAYYKVTIRSVHG